MLSKLTWLCNFGFHKKVRIKRGQFFVVGFSLLLFFFFLCVCVWCVFYIFYFNVNHLSLFSALALHLVYVCSFKYPIDKRMSVLQCAKEDDVLCRDQSWLRLE